MPHPHRARLERALLAATAAGALLAAAAAVAGPPIGTLLGPAWAPLRLAAALPAALLLPGYALTAALFPRASGLDAMGRLALSVGLSVAQLPLAALALSHSPWAVSPIGLVGALVSLTLGWCAVALVRTRATVAAGSVARPAAERPASPAGAPPLARLRMWLRGLSRLERAVLALCAALLGSCAAALLLVLPRSDAPPGAEFFMLGARGQADAFPQAAAPGRPVSVQVGLHNRGPAAVEYFVVALGETGIVGSIPPFSVPPDGAWSGALSVALPTYGFDQRVDVILFQTGEQRPHRRLRLILDVPPPGEPTPLRIRPTPIPRP